MLAAADEGYACIALVHEVCGGGHAGEDIVYVYPADLALEIGQAQDDVREARSRQQRGQRPAHDRGVDGQAVAAAAVYELLRRLAGRGRVCGAELKPEAKFCPKCGVKIDQISEEENSGKPEFSGEFSKAEQEKIASGQVNTKEGIFAKIWNHPAFTMIAVKFGNVLDILLGAVSLLLAVMLLGDGFFGTVWGILFLVCGIAIVFSGIRAFLSRKREPETEEELNKKKRNLCIGAAVIIIGLLVINSTGGGVYSDVKSIAFDDIGPETIGELIDENVKGAEWSQEKIDSNSRLVFVEGYCPSYSEDIRITFFYEDLDDGYCEVSLQSIEFPESGEYYDDAFSAGIIWASLYE